MNALLELSMLNNELELSVSTHLLIHISVEKKRSLIRSTATLRATRDTYAMTRINCTGVPAEVPATRGQRGGQ